MNKETKKNIINKLCNIGYGNMANSETEKKMEFGKGYAPTGFQKQIFHVHIREKGDNLPDEIYFRDELRKNAAVHKEYEKLKLSLAEKHKYNREDYTNAKTEFIRKITELAKSHTSICM